MDREMVEQLFRGVGIIIDDDAKKDGTPAFELLTSIQNEKRPMVIYDFIPDEAEIDSFGNIAFIILDWDFSGQIKSSLEDSDISLGSELLHDQEQTIMSFLKKLLEKMFVPVFLITGQDFAKVKEELIDAGIYSEDKPSRIMLKAKSDIKDYSTLMEQIQKWLTTSPSAFVLKLWEKEAVVAKNSMFLDMYNASSDWVNVLLGILKEDTKNNKKAVNHDFAEILNSNFVNRIAKMADYVAVEGTSEKYNVDEIRKVLQGERYIPYTDDSIPSVSYTGDLYQDSNEDATYPYRLNVRAQCDMIREDNPRLYLIRGKEVDVTNIMKQSEISIKEDEGEKILTIGGQQYQLKNLNLEGETDRFNKDMKIYERSLIYNNGDILEKKMHSVIACIADKKFIEFNFRKFEIEKKKDVEGEAKRIGRVLPPYITKVQNAFAAYMIRVGVMPIPEKLVEVGED